MGETDTTRVFFKVAGILGPKEFKKQVETIMSILNWNDTSVSLSSATGYLRGPFFDTKYEGVLQNVESF